MIGLFVSGVWTPGQKPADNAPIFQLTDVTKLVGASTIEDNEPPRTGVDEQRSNTPPVVIWTPKSSPTPDRKQFRPVNFESPTLSRKNKANFPFIPVAAAPEVSRGILIPRVKISGLGQAKMNLNFF